MQATAHFETDFLTLMSDAKQASLDALMGETPENWALISTGRRNVAWLDALRYVAKNFPGCDRRRRKREFGKALRKALAGDLQLPRDEIDALMDTMFEEGGVIEIRPHDEWFTSCPPDVPRNPDQPGIEAYL